MVLTRKQRVEYGAIHFILLVMLFFLFGGPWKMYDNHKWALNGKGREPLDDEEFYRDIRSYHAGGTTTGCHTL